MWDGFFSMLEDITAREHARGIIPWATFDLVPERAKYNADEEGKDPMRGRGKIVGSARSKIERARTFDIGDGDRA